MARSTGDVRHHERRNHRGRAALQGRVKSPRKKGALAPAYAFTAAKDSFAAATVFCTSSSLCAAPRKAASYCDGGRYTPQSSMLRKNFANNAVFDFEAESQSVTGPGLKNHVNIDPTRL